MCVALGKKANAQENRRKMPFKNLGHGDVGAHESDGRRKKWKHGNLTNPDKVPLVAVESGSCFVLRMTQGVCYVE